MHKVENLRFLNPIKKRFFAFLRSISCVEMEFILFWPSDILGSK